MVGEIAQGWTEASYPVYGVDARYYVDATASHGSYRQTIVNGDTSLDGHVYTHLGGSYAKEALHQAVAHRCTIVSLAIVVGCANTVSRTSHHLVDFDGAI